MAPRTRTNIRGNNRRFTLLFCIFLVLSVALWLFYRWLFNNDSSYLAVGVISLITAWFWAYLVGYGEK